MLATAAASVLIVCAAVAQSNSTTAQAVTMEVKAITKLVVSGTPSALVIHDFAPGADQAVAQDQSTDYSITTNLENMKVVASINQQMPSGTQLMVALSSTKGNSVGTVDISNAMSPVNVVTGIRKGTEANQRITYIFAANATVGEIPQESRTITLTLTD